MSKRPNHNSRRRRARRRQAQKADDLVQSSAVQPDEQTTTHSKKILPETASQKNKPKKDGGISHQSGHRQGSSGSGEVSWYKDRQKKRTARRRREADALRPVHESATPLFNEKLRVKGKWIFALLAVIFGMMFVLTGVGMSGSGPSILDILPGGAANQRAEEAAEETDVLSQARIDAEENPDDYMTQLKLAEAQINAGESAEALELLERAQNLPGIDKNIEAQRVIMRIYLAEAGDASQAINNIDFNTRPQPSRPGVPPSLLPGSISNVFNDALLSSGGYDPVAQSQLTTLSQRIDAGYQGAATAAETLVKLNPNDPADWVRLAELRQRTGNPEGAVEAYQRFIKMAPGDPLVPQIEEQIESIRKQQLEQLTQQASQPLPQ